MSRLAYSVIVRPPHLPSKSSPWPDKPQGGLPRGTQTPPAVPGENSYPFRQGPANQVGGPPQTGPTQDPRRNAVLSLSSPILLPSPTSSSRLEFFSSQATPSTPILPQPFHGMHPSRLARLGTDVFNPTFVNNSEPPAVANPAFGPLRSLPTGPVSIPRSESIPSIPTGMRPDRIPLLSVYDQPLSVASDEAYFTALPRDEPIPSSSRVTLDSAATSFTPELLLPGTFITSLNSSNRPAPTEDRHGPDPSPNRRKKNRPARKRKAKKEKRLSGKNAGGSGASRTWGRR